MTIIDFPKKPQKEEEPEDLHLSGEAICVNCQYKFMAVMPIGLQWFDCPECGLEKAAYIGHAEPPDGTPVWHCNGCNGNLFYVTDDGWFCPNCAKWMKA